VRGDSLDQNYIVTPRVWLGTLPVIVQPVFEFRHPLFKTIKALPDNHGSRLSVSAPVHGIPPAPPEMPIVEALANRA
jgi:hypothetical protein